MGKKDQKNSKNKVPVRMCISCRSRKPKQELVRFVLNSDRMPMLDTDGGREGRGVNICASEECFDKAVEKGAFNRAWNVRIPGEVWEKEREDFVSFIEKRKFRGGKGPVVHRVSKEEAEKLLLNKVTRS